MNLTKKLISFYLGAACVFLIFASSCSRSQENLYSWAKWSSFTDSTARGYISIGDEDITVTMSSDVRFGSTLGIHNYNAFNKFKGITVDTIVPNTTWASAEGKIGTTSMCFYQTVNHPVLLLSSVGNRGYNVSLSFSKKYTVLYDGGGMTFSNDSTLIGSEGNAILIFPGDIDCISIKSSRPEVYTNVSWALSSSSFKGNTFKWLLFLLLGITIIFIILFWQRRKSKKKNT